ncbi:hypothetical protein BJY17_000468 [Agromyces hippuratus]|uniref:Uncharacterized protein n=1 Tax=Agromyces hippuratus TaxID=286438 RepID=A0A852X0Q2_9MICO|nr:hypothetical protein [Agromyces hippuratus]NYG19721.1 hypothetical protein [Agromyces hippuratus]
MPGTSGGTGVVTTIAIGSVEVRSASGAGRGAREGRAAGVEVRSASGAGRGARGARAAGPSNP